MRYTYQILAILNMDDDNVNTETFVMRKHAMTLGPIRQARKDKNQAAKFAKKGAKGGVAPKSDPTSRGIADGSLMPSGNPWVRASWASPKPRIASNVPGHNTPRVGLSAFEERAKKEATTNPNSLVGPDGYRRSDMQPRVPASSPLNKLPKRK